MRPQSRCHNAASPKLFLSTSNPENNIFVKVTSLARASDRDRVCQSGCKMNDNVTAVKSRDDCERGSEVATHHVTNRSCSLEVVLACGLTFDFLNTNSFRSSFRSNYIALPL